jgi:hypothetical protein
LVDSVLFFAGGALVVWTGVTTVVGAADDWTTGDAEGEGDEGVTTVVGAADDWTTGDAEGEEDEGVTTVVGAADDWTTGDAEGEEDEVIIVDTAGETTGVTGALGSVGGKDGVFFFTLTYWVWHGVLLDDLKSSALCSIMSTWPSELPGSTKKPSILDLKAEFSLSADVKGAFTVVVIF